MRRDVHAIATVLPSEASDHLSDAGITWFSLDVTVEKSVLELKSQVAAFTGGQLDVLINCAWVHFLLVFQRHMCLYIGTDLTKVAYVISESSIIVSMCGKVKSNLLCSQATP